MSKTGANEPGWGDGGTINIHKYGCEHNCRYCYARKIAMNPFFGGVRCTAEQWAEPVIDMARVNKGYRKRKGRVMFPSAHDITPRNFSQCFTVLHRLLEAGNDVVIVSKPHFECIRQLTSLLSRYRRNVEFRFTMGSVRADVLEFWEPGAPSYDERIGCLLLAHHRRFATSISCEPMLDRRPGAVWEDCFDHVTEAVWFGKMNKMESRVNFSTVEGGSDSYYLNMIRETQTDEAIRSLYEKMKDKEKVRWKDSIRKVIGI